MENDEVYNINVKFEFEFCESAKGETLKIMNLENSL